MEGGTDRGKVAEWKRSGGNVERGEGERKRQLQINGRRNEVKAVTNRNTTPISLEDS